MICGEVKNLLWSCCLFQNGDLLSIDEKLQRILKMLPVRQKHLQKRKEITLNASILNVQELLSIIIQIINVIR